MRTITSMVLAAAFVISAWPAAAQAEIKVNQDVNLQFGVLGQFAGDTITDPVSNDQIQNLFVRRLRLISGGDVAKNVSFFVEAAAPNLGRAPVTKNTAPAVIVQDAFASFSARNLFILDAGLLFVPFSRNSVPSEAASTYDFTVGEAAVGCPSAGESGIRFAPGAGAPIGTRTRA